MILGGENLTFLRSSCLYLFGERENAAVATLKCSFPLWLYCLYARVICIVEMFVYRCSSLKKQAFYTAAQNSLDSSLA